MGPRGFEQIQKKASQIAVDKEVNKNHAIHPIAQKVHNRVHIKTYSTELQEIINQWETLPEHIKAAIFALMRIHQNK